MLKHVDFQPVAVTLHAIVTTHIKHSNLHILKFCCIKMDTNFRGGGETLAFLSDKVTGLVLSNSNPFVPSFTIGFQHEVEAFAQFRSSLLCCFLLIVQSISIPKS